MRHLYALAAAAAVATYAGHANAAGFAVAEQSPSGLGVAFSGGAAAAEDASTIWYNPAGMTYLQNDVVAGGHLIIPRADFNVSGSSNAAGAPINGATDDGGEVVIVPNGYGVLAPTDRLRAGVGVNFPFGLTTDYDETWIGRYFGTTSKLEVLNINPAVAYRVTDWLSLGAGFNIQYLDATLSRQVDTGTLSGVPANFNNADTLSQVEGDSWGYGFNAGAIVEPIQGLRFGAHYRSAIDHDIDDGTVTFTPANAVAAAVAAGAGLVNQGARSTVTLPETISGSVFYQFRPDWAVMADVTWYNWSRLKTVTFIFDNGVTTSETFNYSDTYRVSGGTIYDVNDWLSVRGGVAWDETPTNDTDRSVRLPDESRLWLTLGSTIKVSDTFEITGSYAYIHFLNDPAINQTTALTGNTLTGTFDASVHILSIQGRLKF